VFFSTALTLFVVPVAYVVLASLLERSRTRREVVVPLTKAAEGD